MQRNQETVLDQVLFLQTLQHAVHVLPALDDEDDVLPAFIDRRKRVEIPGVQRAGNDKDRRPRRSASASI